MTYETKTTKCNFNGWRCETIINLQPCVDGYNKPATRALEFTTLKRHSGISTHASVMIISENGNKSYIIFEDYSKNVMVFPKKRATEKTMQECHQLASEKFVEHLAAAKIQYKIEGI